MKTICADLKEEYESLDAVVAKLSSDGWMIVTPFFSWTIKEQISHLAYFDKAAGLSILGSEPFEHHLNELLEHAGTHDEVFAYANSHGMAMDETELLDGWRRERRRLISSYETLDPGQKLPWYGPPMSARSSATARLMETWAHGQDIVDALGVKRKATSRLKHIVHLGFSTFTWSFMNRGLTVPAMKPALRLEGPDGEIWNYGTANAENTVTGSALDFCLVVTQRRHVTDTRLVIQGDIASSWLAIAQAFAGPPQDPPYPGTRVSG